MFQLIDKVSNTEQMHIRRWLNLVVVDGLFENTPFSYQYVLLYIVGRDYYSQFEMNTSSS